MNFLADRLNAGVNLQARADAIGINRRTLERIERDPEARPAPDVAKKVADFYKLTVLDVWPLPDRAAA